MSQPTNIKDTDKDTSIRSDLKSAGATGGKVPEKGGF